MQVCARVCVCVFMTKIVNYVNWPRPTELVIVGVPERLCEGGSCRRDVDSVEESEADTHPKKGKGGRERGASLTATRS